MMTTDPPSQPLPLRKSFLLRWIGRATLALLGWRIQGGMPTVPKAVAIVAPHTSNWDFVLGLATILALEVRVDWLGKNSIFRWPFKRLLQSLGGIPVNRANSHGVVQQTVALFGQRKNIILGLSPEGTRKKVTHWKSGFYHIAVNAGVPLFLASLDYRLKEIQLGPLFYPCGDWDTDLPKIQTHFAKATPRYPHQY